MEQSKPQMQIILHAEGSFYEVYEHSAWLFSTCIRAYDVRCRYVKCVGQYMVKLGFPQKVLETVRTQFDVRTDGDLAFIMLDRMPSGCYEDWRAGIVEEASSSSVPESSPFPVPESSQTSISEKEILDEIAQFPLERKNPMECMIFLSEIKQKLNAILH